MSAPDLALSPGGAGRRAGRRLLVSAILGERTLVVAAILSGIGWQLVAIGMPVVLGWTVARGIEDGDTGAVWIGGAAVLVLGAAEAACDAARHWLENAASARTAARLREAVVDASLRFGDDDRDHFGEGDLVARGTSDVDVISDLVDGLGYSAGYALTLPVALAILFWIDPTLGLVCLAVTVVAVLLVWQSSGVWERRGEAFQEAVAATVAAAQETIAGFKTVRGVGADEAALARFTTKSETLREQGRSVTSLWTIFEPLLDVLSIVSVVAVLVIGGTAAADGDIGVGAMVTALGLALFLVAPIRVIGEWVVRAQLSLASAGRLAEVVGRAPVRDAAASAAPAEAPGPRLVARGASFAYPLRPETRAVDGVDLALGRGDVVLVRGPVGAGKSTLLALLAGQREPTAGAVTLDGTPLDAWPTDLLRRRILRVDQRPLVLSGTVLDNLLLGRPEAPPDEVREAVDLAGATAVVDELPAGLETQLGPRGAMLSGGQRQRLALARAVIAAPDVLVLDGATSSIEPALEATILRRLAARWQHGILVLVTPNIGAEAIAGTVIDVREGRAEVIR